MPEPKRLESHASVETADRESRAEALLVEGLDRYFAGQFEEAIHLWTRVLFLDRSHARARAYIDRARTAIAERQRCAEEMLHLSSDLLADGQIDQARDLLTQAVRASGEDERAAELRARMERLERARGFQPPAAVVDAMPIPGRRRFAPWGWAVMGAVVALAAALFIAAPVFQESLGFGVSPALAPPGSTAPVTGLSSGDVAIIRARTLYARGRLAEALRALDRVDAISASRLEADQLRAEIQRILLGTRRSRPPGTSAEAGRP